jgi:hypothetical protein
MVSDKDAGKDKDMDTVTVTRLRRGKYGLRFSISFSKLPKQDFGPYDLTEAVRDLRISALLSPIEARNLVMDAAVDGTATTETK